MVRANREKNIDYYRDYDKGRMNEPSRVEGREKYAKSEAGKVSHKKANEKYSLDKPKAYRAKNAVNNAIRDGRLIPWPCCAVPECNRKPHAHHPDYDQPLDVVWLCPQHHKDAHGLV
jgi:hypothetical protein